MSPSPTAVPSQKIDELADASGVTVRTYRICQLKQLGIPLDAVRMSLDGSAGEIGDVIAYHLRDVERRLAIENRLRARLARLVGREPNPQQKFPWAAGAPVDQPCGCREYGALDGEGHLRSFMNALEH